MRAGRPDTPEDAPPPGAVPDGPDTGEGSATRPVSGVRRRLWLLIALLSAAVLVLPIAVQVYGQIMHRTTTHSHNYALGPSQGVEIDGGSATVEVRAGKAGRVRVQQQLGWTLRSPRVNVDQEPSGTLHIEPSCARSSKLFSSLDCDVTLRVTMPADAPLRVTTGSGSIQLRNLGGTLKAVASSGTITGTGLRSTEVSGTANSGMVQFDMAGTPRRLSLDAESGTAQATVPRGSRFQLSTAGGTGTLQVAPGLSDRNSGNRLDLTVNSGTVQVGYTGCLECAGAPSASAAPSSRP
ncbi:hypothetical protein BIV57_09810 [Mangrovactinospora gilvigrisea]|uniref:DUF4097 domain-containing protein n=1 Tax=Mangrovactinospora gilvigrisea TaxID=1428644 RepID=A0A1J7C808_9ACTN|nr:DUF4097 family beta strand repeat-containing protein [Mangrovactinospora gilvigrisea]OIV37656.1 hypothetical protein BIV57_09810 [Mangrovactinospora gilvigrisea]